MNTFEVASTARRSDEEVPGRLFVGEMTPHNAERPWLVIRGVASSAVLVTVEQVATLPGEQT